MQRHSLLRGALASAVAVPAAASASASPAHAEVTDRSTDSCPILDRTRDWSGISGWSFAPGTTSGWNDPFENRFRETSPFTTLREVQAITDAPKPPAAHWDDVTGGTLIRAYRVSGADCNYPASCG